MVRETRHLWVGNLPDNIREDRIREHFKRYGRVQSVKLLPPRGSSGSGSGTSGTGSGSEEGGGGLCAAVAFMDIKSASKAHTAEHKLDERSLTTEYYEPPTAAILHLHESTPSGPVTPTSGTTTTVGAGGVYPPRSPRFPHGPAEEFERSSHFYRGGVGPVGAASGPEVEGYIPRRPGQGPNYTDGLRGRTRDRQQSYRNGPPYQPPHLETGRGAGAASHHRAGSGGGSGGAWSYETPGTRYPGGVDPEETSRQSAVPCTPSSPASVTATSPSQAAPSAPAAMLTLNSASASAARKSRHAKRRRGSGRTVGSGGVSDSEQSSGRGSRSSSRSSCSSSPAASSSSSNSSRSTSPGGSPRGRSRLPMPPPSSHHNSTHAEDRRPLAICVRNLPARSSDTSLKDGLFHEYKKHGKVTWVKVVGTGGDRYALVCFKKPEDVDKALEVSHDKLFFGCKIDVAPYEGFDVEDNDFRPYEAELDEFHPKATRTLFIGNLEKDVTAAELRKHFEQFGEIIEIDIKKQGSVSSYAFCQYADIGAVVAAMRSMDGEHLGNNRIKLGFGKSMPTNCVWVDGVAESVSEKYLNMQFLQFGPLAQVAVDRARGHALVFFEQLSCAQAAVKELRGVAIRGRRLQLDFASRECQEAFYAHLEKQGSPSERVWERPPATFDAREPVVPRFEGVPPAAAPVNARFPIRYEASTRGAARGGPHGAHRGAATGPATTQRAGRAGRQPPPPRFADYYDEFGAERTRFRPGSGEEYLSHEEGGSYEQELRDYGYCQRERRTDYPGDSEHSPSPAQLAPEEGTEDAATSSSIPIPARRHSRQLSTASEHDSPPRHASPPNSKRIHPRLLSCSPRTPYYEDKESDATKTKDSLSPTPSSNVTSIISGSKCDLNSCNRGPHRHVDGKEPPPPVPPPLPSLPPPRSAAAVAAPLPPPSAPESDMKHLQKERVHIKQLLDQLGESQSSSGDESVNNKRLKLNNEHNKVIINNNNSQGSSSTESAVDKSECVVGKPIPFRKIIEPRRLSDLKGRRISTDGDKYHHRGDYAPSHFIPKRRKTESSSEGGDGEHHGHPPHRDSSDGSRPGTPLCDERPECLIPCEPRRPRDRSTDGPISLPLPKFAHQLLSPRPGCGGPGKIVYSIKSPPSIPLPLRHRIEPPPRNEEKKETASGESSTNEIPLSPSRPDSASESERSPRASPTLEERIRMLDEKYEAWTGSRTLLSTTLSTEVMHKKDGEKFKLRTKLPDLNELRSQPSEIVKSVLAKRSVFDEDTKRLENYNDKYEPKDFASTSWRSVAALVTTNKTPVIPTSILKTEVKSEVASPSWSKTKPLLSNIPLPTSSPSSTSPPVITSPKSILVTSRTITTTPKSPFSTGTPTIPVLPPKPNPIPPQQQVKPVAIAPKTVPSPTTSPRPSAKGLQYPFPSHPPASSPVVPGSPRCQPPLSSPVQCSPALESTEWPPAQPPGLPTPPPSACGSPCIPTTAPPPSEETPQLNKTAIKKENNIISRDPTPVKNISSTSSSSITTTSITSSVVKKENPLIVSTTNSSSTSTPIKIETPVTPVEIKQEVSSPPCAPISRKDSHSSSSSTSSTSSTSSLNAPSKKESSHKSHHKSHSQDRVSRSNERRESTEERTRTKERHNSGKEHRPASVGSKRRISSQDELQLKEPAVISSVEQPETKRPKLSPSNSTEKSQKSSKATPDRRDSKDGSRKAESSKKSDERRKHSSEKSDRDKKYDEKSKTSEDKSRSSEEKSKSSDDKEKVRSFDEKSKHSEEKSSRNSEEKSSRSSEEKSSRSSEDKSSRSLDDRSSRNSEEKSSRSLEEKSSRSSEEKSSRNSEDKASKNPDEKSSRNSEEKSSRNCDDKTKSSEEKSRSSEEKSSRSSEEKSRSSEEKSRSSEENREKSREEKSSHDRKSHSEKKSHSNPSSQNSQTERGDGDRHKSKERKRSKSERERSGDVRRADDKQRSKDEGRERSKHDPDDKSKSSSKQRDKKSDKSDKSSRRSESERRKDRSTPKKASSQPPPPTTPATPQPQPQQPPQQSTTPPQICQDLEQQQLLHSIPRQLRDSANSDSDLSEEGRLKKHSIFDIVDDEPAYISMYDKVKARSTKNMQKQEEEKQKERLKEKFNQLKQSRAKREEKKRSTSWDEDTDSDGTGISKLDRLLKPSKRHGKLVITSSSEDEGGERRRSRLPICSDITNTDESESELKMKQRNHRDRNPRLLKSEPDNTDDDDGDGSARTKLLHPARRIFKPKITSDTSDYDDHQKYKPSSNFDIYSDSDGDKHHITSTPFNTPAVAKTKLKLENSLELFESSDESNNKFDKKHFDVKFKHEFSENEAPNSLGNSERIHGNCVDKQQRKSHKKSKRRLSGKNNCTVSEQQVLPATEELEVRLERLDESRLRLGDHKRPSEEKQRSSAEPDKVEHKTEHKQRSSVDSEHKKHSKRERRRSGHHEEKGDLDSSKTSSKARKKKSKKESTSIKSESKQRDDKMEDIFGPLSDDSEPEAVQTIHAEAKLTPANNNNTYNSACTRKWQFNSVYSSDSDSNVDTSLIHRSPPNLPVTPQVKVETPEIPIPPPTVESGARRAEEKRRKRERRSRERRERKMQREIQREISSERVVDDDLAEAGRVLESQLQEDSPPSAPRPPLAPPMSQSFDVFHFTDDESASAESCERPKEKKKKRKRSKEERSRKDHHDKSNREVDHDRKSSSKASEESIKLPNLLLSPKSPNFSPEPVKIFPKIDEESVSEELKFESVVKPSVVASEKKRPEKLIPGFGTDVDAAIHETAVKSISGFDEEPVPVVEPTPAPPALLCQRDASPELQEKDEKPRTVISQEETEDAVAALLEETFDFRRYSDEADEEAAPHHHEPQPVPQDDHQLPSEEVEKETQQAVQSLECELPLVTVATPAAPDHDAKQHKEEEERADTPQSEHDLQIDESVQPCSEDESPASPRHVPLPQSPPKSPERPPSSPPDIMDFSRPPKTPDLPAAFYQQQQQLAESALEEKPEEIPPIVNKVEEEKEIIPEVAPPAPEIKEAIPEVKPIEEPVQEKEKIIVETPVVKEEVKVPSPAVPVVVEPEPVPLKEITPTPAEELKVVEEVKEEVKKEIVEPPVVIPEVPQSPLKVRKVELSAPIMQAMQEAAATPTISAPIPDEHETIEEEDKISEISLRCTRGRGGRGGRGRGKAISRGGVSTRRSARGGRVGTASRPEADHSHTEESAEEKSGETEHSVRGRKSRRGRKKKSESGDDKSKPKSSETNDIYEFHDTDDEDVHFEAKSAGEKPAVLSPPPLLPPTATVAVPVKTEEPSKPQTPPPEEVPPVPETPVLPRRDSVNDDGSGRPRLILTIKSPMKECIPKVETREEFEQHSETSDLSESLTSPQAPLANVKSPSGPTRKSRRLQEKDSSRSTVDDIIEEVIRGTYKDESAPTSPSPAEQTRTTRRSVRTTRQRGSEEPVPPPSQRPFRTSKSDDEKQDVVKPPSVMKIDIPKPATAVATTLPQTAQQIPQVPTGAPGVRPLQGPHLFTRGNREEPTTLIDPVTGLLIPMRESEEGQYIPVTTSVSVIQGPPTSDAALKQRMLQKLPVKPVELPQQGPLPNTVPTAAAAPPVHQEPLRVVNTTRVNTSIAPPVRPPATSIAPPVRPPATVSMTPTGTTVVKLVPSSTAAPAPPTLTVTKVQQPPTTRPPVTTSSAVSYGSPRGPEIIPGAPYPPWPSHQQQSAPSPPGRPPAVKPPPMAHASSHPGKFEPPTTSAQPPSVQGARPCHPQPQPAHSASSTPASYGQPDRRDVGHRSRAKDEEIPLSMLPPRLRVGAVARTSASAALPAPAASSTPSAEPHGLQGCIVASGAPAQPRPPRATSRESPVSGGRPSMAHTAHSQVLQAGLPVPAYEASLHAATSPAELQQGGGAYLLPPPPLPLPPQQKDAYMLAGAQVIERVPNRHPPSAATSRSPPPAHQQGEVVRVAPGQHQQHPAAGFGVGVPVAHLARAGPGGAPHEVPAHVLHQQLFYQQFLRAQQQQQQHQHELAPPPPPNSHHHQPAYHLPPAPPGASRSPAVPGLEGKAETPEASNESLALGPRGHARGPASPPLELRRSASSGATIPRMPPAAAHLHSPHDRTTDSPQVATVYGGSRLVHHPPHLQSGLPRGAEPDKHHSVPPSAHPSRQAYMQRAYEEEVIYRHPPPPPAHRRHGHPTPGQEAPPSHPAALQQPPQPRLQVQTPPHASQVPPQADSLLMLLQRYPVMWQGLLALKNDQAAVQMHFVFGNPGVAQDSLPCNADGTTPPLRIAQRMRLEQTQLEGVARKMQIENEHCMLLALPCGRDHMDVLQQSNNLNSGFITYLQQKQAAGIVNIAAPGSQQAAYVVHIFPSCEFANDNLARIAPDLLHRVADLSHLLIIIATV